ncbi:hypothetical protein [Priestia koreensis]|uniref:hypothetical protein n=1 Tax=Priestia koreensis TaxID=284581 RepID=UPI0020401A8B|nr:hypothetical protein [Priestia koreensis]MCM3005905.1 hypothetical protein [Priestia koreensis]
MKKWIKIPLFFLSILLVIVTAACSNETNITSPKKDQVKNIDFSKYVGRELKLGIIGKIPTVRENNVHFSTLSFQDLKDDKFSSYDAVFITKENLNEASQSIYADVYLKSKIPFYFIKTEKSYIPFVDPDSTYENTGKVSPKSFLTGYRQEGSNNRYWEYSLYNDIETKKTVEDVYSRVFMDIEKVKNTVSKK